MKLLTEIPSQHVHTHMVAVFQKGESQGVIMEAAYLLKLIPDIRSVPLLPRPFG